MPNLSINQSGSLTTSRSLAGLRLRISAVPNNICGRYGSGVLENQLLFVYKTFIMGMAGFQSSVSISKNHKHIIKRFRNLYRSSDKSTQ